MYSIIVRVVGGALSPLADDIILLELHLAEKTLLGLYLQALAAAQQGH